MKCFPLETSGNVNSSIIIHTVDDVLLQSGAKRNNFELLLCMPLTLHMAHLLHNCAMRVVLSFKILMT